MTETFEDWDVSVCDKKLLESKIFSNPAKIGDLDKVHKEVLGLEEAVSRTFRVVNRNISQLNEADAGIQKDTNAGFALVAGRVDKLDLKLGKLEEKYERFVIDLESRDNLEYDEIRSSGASRLLTLNKRQEIIPPIPPHKIPQSSGIGRNENQNSLGNKNNLVQNNSIELINNGDQRANEFELNILGEASSSGPQLGVFNGETAFAFDEWMIKFTDYIDVFGMTWTEPEKINRLKLYLGTQARSIFESLTVNERQTLATTLKNIRKKLDSPHFRELAYKRLAACYQRESESVNDFIKRLVPLVNSTSCQVPPEVKEETLCRCFMEKVRPEYQRSLQLVGPLIGRKDFDKLTAYVQELEVASEKESRTFNDGIHAITEQPNQMPRGRFDTWKLLCPRVGVLPSDKQNNTGIEYNVYPNSKYNNSEGGKRQE
uniref:Uncharacterized protein n=1 Tax=Meloidogyne enterolobii TaxID=390850 RepID=A0A6V7XLV6_MELEN|nr:unnamed protein product [Meloidogyne enterolobii]